MTKQEEIDVILTNTASDVPSIFSDGVGAYLGDDSVVKMSFYEHLMSNSGEQTRRFVVNLTMPRDAVKLMLERMAGALGGSVRFDQDDEDSADAEG